MKTIIGQVKTIMQIGNTSDFKEAIEILAKLQSSGVGSKDVSRVVGSLGGMASVAGVSLQKMMSTVGAQGEYLFASNGMNPYGGQLAAANAYGAFSAAQRSGLMSRSLLARMGGVEGATQSEVGALVGAAQTPYASMSMYNKFLNGGESRSIVGNVSKFGGAMARGGLAAVGEFEYNRAEMASKMLEDGGHAKVMDMVYQIAQSTPGAMKDGKVKAGAMYEILTKQIGLTDAQAHANIEAQRGAQDAGTLTQTLAGLNSGMRASRQKYLENEGYGMIWSPVTRKITKGFMAVQGYTSNLVSKPVIAAGRLEDSLTHLVMSNAALAESPWEIPIGQEVLKTAIAKHGSDRSFKAEVTRSLTIGYDSAALNKLAHDPEVIKGVKTKDRGLIEKAISRRISTDPDTFGDYKSGPARNRLINLIMAQGLDKVYTEDDVNNKLAKLTGSKDGQTARDLVNLIQRVAKTGGTNRDIAEYNRLVPGANIAQNDIDSLKTGLDSAARSINFAAPGAKGNSSELLTDSSQMVDGMNSSKAGQDATLANKKSQVDFSGGIGTDLFSRAYDTDNRAVRVIIVPGSGVGSLDNSGNPVLSMGQWYKAHTRSNEDKTG